MITCANALWYASEGSVSGKSHSPVVVKDAIETLKLLISAQRRIRMYNIMPKTCCYS